MIDRYQTVHLYLCLNLNSKLAGTTHLYLENSDNGNGDQEDEELSISDLIVGNATLDHHVS